jgi:CRP/FNR family transcriptional regulator, cyclic AMP receptor protein
MIKFFHSLWSRVNYNQIKSNEILEIIQSIPIFAGLNSRAYKLLVSILHLRIYQKGEHVFLEGEEGNGMYILQKGKIRIIGKDNKNLEILYAELIDRDFFGEVSLVDQGPRSASAICDEESVIFGFFKPDLFQLIEKNPKIGTKILINLSSFMALRLRESNRKLNLLQEMNQN